MGAEHTGPTRRRGLETFVRFVLDHRSQVYNVAYRILGDQKLAAGVTQDTFNRALPVYGELGGESARLWLMRTVVGICREHLSHGTHPRLHPAARNDAFQMCLGALPAEQRIALVLSDVRGLGYREIAEITGFSLSAVESHLSRGRARLRDELVSLDLLPPKGRPGRPGALRTQAPVLVELECEGAASHIR